MALCGVSGAVLMTQTFALSEEQKPPLIQSPPESPTGLVVPKVPKTGKLRKKKKKKKKKSIKNK